MTGLGGRADSDPAVVDSSISRARVVLESGYTLRPDVLTEFGAAFRSSLRVVAEQPGFQCVVGSAMLNSRWLYFYGSWENAELMDQWYWHRRHKPLQDGGFARWFDRMYMRKWREPIAGEKPAGKVFCQTEICTTRVLTASETKRLLDDVRNQFDVHKPAPFETLTGEFEDDPFQLVGPVTQFPAPDTQKYLVLTHWAAAPDAKHWLDSSDYSQLATTAAVSTNASKSTAVSTVSTAMLLPMPDAPGTRPGLRADGLQRDWTAETGPCRSPRSPEEVDEARPHGG